jgi:hypothetical protein
MIRIDQEDPMNRMEKLLRHNKMQSNIVIIFFIFMRILY